MLILATNRFRRYGIGQGYISRTETRVVLGNPKQDSVVDNTDVNRAES